MPTNAPSPAPHKKSRRKSSAGDAIGAAIAFLMLAFSGIAVNVVAYNDFVAIKDDLWFNSHGVLARNGYLHVRHGIRTASSLCAYYDTQEGKAYSKCIELWFPLVNINEQSPEVIHYDPASPEHISTSWGRQILFSRSVMFLVVLAFSVFLDLAAIMVVIMKITGGKLSPPSKDPVQSSPAEATTDLLDAALELSETLDQIVGNLQSQTGPNAPYAQAVALELIPLISQYNHAVDGRSRDLASRALDEVVACMNDFKADKKKRRMHFGFRQWWEMRKYESLRDLFRETKYRNGSL